MDDYIIMSGIARRFTDTEIADIISLFGEDPILSILEDGTTKDRTRRAERRKATAHKHQRLDILVDINLDEESPLRKKNAKKSMHNAHGRRYEDGRDLSRLILREAKAEALYEERRSQFFKAVDQWQHDEEEVFVYASTPSYKVHVKLNDCREYDFDTLDEALDFVEHCAYGYSISRRNYDYPLHDVNEDGDCITYQGKEYYIDGCWYGFYLDNLGAHYYL